MAESVVSVEVHVHVVDDKQLKVVHHTPPSETDTSNSIQQAATSTSADGNCGYVPIVSDERSAGETVKTVNDSKYDLTDGHTHSQCNIQQQQHQELNAATRADHHISMTITDDNDVSTQSNPVPRKLIYWQYALSI